jgi:outer membrane protein, heavy metal efflux system
MPSEPSSGTFKRPTWRRCFVLGVSFLIVAVRATISGAEGLTEESAIALGLARPALGDVRDGRVALASAEHERARRWPNPVASYQHEEGDGPSGSTDDYAWLSQTFDLAGRRHTRGKAAAIRVDAARAEGESMLETRRASIRERFYQALLSQERAAAFRDWRDQGMRVGKIIEKRAEAGEASGYDRRRFEQEEALARARAATAEAETARARAQLAGLVGATDEAGAAWSGVAGPLRPSDDLPPLAGLLAAVTERPDLRALADAQRAADLDGRAAARWWLPDVTVGAGIKRVDVDREPVIGPFISASIPLPLLDQDQADALEASGRLRVSRGEYRLALDAAGGDVEGLWHETAALVLAAKEYRESAIPESSKLVNTAEQAYQAGEIELLNLIDAHRGALEARLQALELEMNARRAWIELARVSGEKL